jgi:hypothetical protein
VNEHTTVKIAAAELAMSCIDLMRRRHDIEVRLFYIKSSAFLSRVA